MSISRMVIKSVGTIAALPLIIATTSAVAQSPTANLAQAPAVATQVTQQPALTLAAVTTTGSPTNGPGVNLHASSWLKAHGISTLPLRPFYNRGVYNGALKTVLAYCEDYGLFLTRNGWISVTSTPKKLSGTIISEMMWTVNHYGGTPGSPPSNTRGAAVAAAILHLASGQFRSDWNATYLHQLGGNSGAVPKLMGTILSKATSLHGRLVIKQSTTAPVISGGIAHTTVTVTSASTGKPEPGVALKASLNGAVMHGTPPSKTNSKGQATFYYVPSHQEGTLKVTAIAPSWTSVFITHPASGEQHLIAQYVNQSVSTTATFTSFGKVALSYNCDNNSCSGKHVPVTGKACNGSTNRQYRWIVQTAAGVLLHTYYANAGTCVDIKVSANDHDKVQAYASYKTSSTTWSSKVLVGSVIVYCAEITNVPVIPFCNCNGDGYLDMLSFTNATLNAETVTTTVTLPDGTTTKTYSFTVAAGAPSKEIKYPVTTSGSYYKVVVSATSGGHTKTRTEYDGHIF